MPKPPSVRFNKSIFLIVVLALLFSSARADEPAYKNPNLPVDERVADLLGRMTLQEKVCQLDMYSGRNSLLEKSELFGGTLAMPDAHFVPERAAQAFGHLGVGAIHDLYAYPPLYNAIQKWVIESNRLGIPALFTGEGLHGYMGYDETIFPQSVNLASTWNPSLARAEAADIASEARADGVDMLFCPVLDVARDPRWGRVEEDFGEDPFLSGQMGLAFVEGMQGDSLATDHTCIAEPKHFVGLGESESGINTASVHAGEREVRSLLLKSFEPAVREGHAMGMMVAYPDIDGVPCIANPWLLKTVLRQEWGFQGFTLSDAGAIRRLYTTHYVAATPAEAVRLALNSGVDMTFYDFDHETFQNAIIEGVKNGQVSEATLDAAVGDVLRVKFLLGLFDHPFVDVNLDKTVRRSPEHLALSLEVARQSLCLLKNQGDLLPLKKDLKRIAVIGPNANIVRLGDYTSKMNIIGKPRLNAKGVRLGDDTSGGSTEDLSEYGIFNQVKKIVSPETRVQVDEGTNIADAVALATGSDVVIMGLGENYSLSGEGHDRSNLDLPGNQEQLLEAVVATGVPVVLVLENGRPLTIPWAAEHVPAILEAWYPGEFGGRAIAETLFGDNNPAGRLTISFPKNLGQLPVYYNSFASKQRRGYVDGNDLALFPFGYGLSYTKFKYDNLKVAVLPSTVSGKTTHFLFWKKHQPTTQGGGDVLVTFDLTNTGERDGDEVAQAYVRETVASVATPQRALKAFTRVNLKAGETRTITLHIKKDDLAVWGAERKWAVEPGEFTIWVGGDSRAKLSETFNLQ